jgi:CHASE2 domain-containing sensor protein
MSPKSSPSQYVIAVVVALLSITAYFLTSSLPLAATSVELVVLSICFVCYTFLLHGLYVLPYHPQDQFLLQATIPHPLQAKIPHLHYCFQILT